MAIYAIADLHLGFDERIEKPMSIYGGQWIGHAERIKSNWERVVKPEDTVIVAGDISWALKLDEAMADLEWIHNLPGKKLLFKGNHELWWSGINKLNTLFDDIVFMQNTCYETEGTAICGSRGWICPAAEDFGESDEKIYRRELLRLEMSLKAANTKNVHEIIGVLHFPPTCGSFGASGFTTLFEEYGVKTVVYGHLHGTAAWSKAIQGNHRGVEYKLVAYDYTKGELQKLR